MTSHKISVLLKILHHVTFPLIYSLSIKFMARGIDETEMQVKNVHRLFSKAETKNGLMTSCMVLFAQPCLSDVLVKPDASHNQSRQVHHSAHVIDPTTILVTTICPNTHHSYFPNIQHPPGKLKLSINFTMSDKCQAQIGNVHNKVCIKQGN